MSHFFVSRPLKYKTQFQASFWRHLRVFGLWLPFPAAFSAPKNQNPCDAIANRADQSSERETRAAAIQTRVTGERELSAAVVLNPARCAENPAACAMYSQSHLSKRFESSSVISKVLIKRCSNPSDGDQPRQSVFIQLVRRAQWFGAVGHRHWTHGVTLVLIETQASTGAHSLSHISQLRIQVWMRIFLKTHSLKSVARALQHENLQL